MSMNRKEFLKTLGVAGTAFAVNGFGALDTLAQDARKDGPVDLVAVVGGEGIVHRDVKPANLFLTEENVIKLLDLGLATSVERPDAVATGHLVGSPGFMAPEQILKEISDQRSDIYSLGCTFYFMLTGHLPYESPEYPNIQSILFAQVAKDMPPLRTYRDDLSIKAENFVRKMTAKNPEDRYQSMEELTAAIAKPAIYISKKKKVDRPAERRQWTSAVSAMILMLFVAVFSFSMFGHELMGRFAASECRSNPISCTIKSKCSPEAFRPSLCDQPCSDMSTLICRSECYVSRCMPEKQECW